MNKKCWIQKEDIFTKEELYELIREIFKSAFPRPINLKDIEHSENMVLVIAVYLESRKSNLEIFWDSKKNKIAISNFDERIHCTKLERKIFELNGTNMLFYQMKNEMELLLDWLFMNDYVISKETGESRTVYYAKEKLFNTRKLNIDCW